MAPPLPPSAVSLPRRTVLLGLFGATAIAPCAMATDGGPLSRSAALRRVAEAVAPALETAAPRGWALSPPSILAGLVVLAAGAGARERASLPRPLAALIDAPAEPLRAGLLPEAAGLRGAAALWLADDITLKPAFAARATALLGATPWVVHDGQFEAAVNAWVALETEGLITRLVDASANEASLIVATALTFRGEWQHRFLARATRGAPFHTAAGTVEVPMMLPEDKAVSVPVLVDRGLEAVMLPYRDGRHAFVAVRASARSTAAPSLASLFDVLAAPEVALTADPPGFAWRRRSIELELPRFTLESGASVKQALADGGYRSLVAGPLTEMANKPLTTSEVAHRAVVSVTEAGTVAAAATAFVEVPISLVVTQWRIVFDQPFLFAIIDRASRTPWFVGAATSPVA